VDHYRVLDRAEQTGEQAAAPEPHPPLGPGGLPITEQPASERLSTEARERVEKAAERLLMTEEEQARREQRQARMQAAWEERERNLEAAKEPAQAQRQGEPGSPDEPGSPEPAQDYLEPDYDTPDDDQHEQDQGERSFGPEDEDRYRFLDARIDTGERQTFEAVREIRREGYWRLERDEHGKPRYESFKEWLEEHRGRDKSWATKGTNLLAVLEAQGRLGISFPLGLKAAQALNPIKGREKCQAVGGLTVTLKEAYEDEPLDKDGRISYDGLKNVVARRLGFFMPTGDKPAATSYQQYRQDYRKAQAWATSLPVKTSSTVMAETLHRGLPREHLKAVCKEQWRLPRPEDLLSRYTGDDLDAVLQDLNLIAEELGDDQELLCELAKKKADLKAQKGLRAEVKALQKQAEERGLIKKQAKKKAACEVKGHLDDAWESMKEALDSEGWPEPEETDRLSSIKEAATNCRDAAIKVLTKADGLLVAADEEPEQIPSE
jgi:hypothetical protein